jgi:hypothetical protein
MRIRRSWILLVVLLFNPVAAWAHGHTADMFAGFTFLKGSSLSGFHETFAVSVPWTTASGAKLFSGIGDLALRSGSHDGNDIEQNAYLGGVRCQFVNSPTAKSVPFAQFLVGRVHSRGSAVSETDTAVGFSAGFEYDLRTEGWAVRGQYDYFHSGGDNFQGFSAGIVYRYKHQP